MRFLKKIWRPVFAILFLAVLIKKGPFKLEQFQFVLSQNSILLLGLFLFLIQLALFSYRWKIFVDHLAFIKFKSAFRLNLVGQFFSFFIPGGVGGDVVKAIELAQVQKMPKSTALSTVIADRVLGLFSMILMTACLLVVEYFIKPDESLKPFLLTSLLFLLVAMAGLLFAPLFTTRLNKYFSQKESALLAKINKLVGSFSLSFEAFRNPKILFQNLSISILVQSISIYFMYFVVQSLGVEAPSFFVFFSICCFGFLASAIPLTPAGIGVGQAAFYFLFSTISSPALGEATVTAFSTMQLFQLFFALFGGIFFSFKPKVPS